MRLLALRWMWIFGLVGAALGASVPAKAILGGTADNGTHPAVAGIISERDGGLVGCTGTLVASKIVLTAGHCVVGTRWTKVSFAEQPEFSAPPVQPQGPQWIEGTPQVHPGYDWPANDIAIVELAAAPAGVAPMQLAGAGTITGMTDAERRGATWTAVGYGGAYSKNGAPQFDYAFVRRVATLDYVRTTTERPAGSAGVNWVNNDGQLQMQNTVDEAHRSDDGSICYGDSGGPLIVGGRVVAELSGPFNGAPCFGGYTYYFRTDTEKARRFLAQHGVSLP